MYFPEDLSHDSEVRTCFRANMKAERLAKAIDQVNRTLGKGLGLLTLFMVGLGSYNAIARYVGSSLGTHLSSNRYLELQWYLFSMVFLLGAANGLRENTHVRVDVLYDRLSTEVQNRINFIGTLVFLLPFCVLMLWAAWRPVVNSWAILEQSPDPAGLPRYFIKSMLPLGFLLLFLQGLAELIKLGATLRKPNPSEAQEDNQGRGAGGHLWE